MGRKREGSVSAEEFWQRYSALLGDEKEYLLLEKLHIPQSTVSGARGRNAFLDANKTIDIAREFGTTAEFLVKGTQLSSISDSEKELLQQAHKWKSVIDDLEALDSAVAASWIAGIHGAAQVAQNSKEAASDAAV